METKKLSMKDPQDRKQIGSLGGKALVAKMGKDYMKEIGKRGGSKNKKKE